jgi:hypothetical protein
MPSQVVTAGWVYVMVSYQLYKFFLNSSVFFYLADDVILLFGFPIRLKGIGYDELDYKLSVDMIHVWSTFAKTGYKTNFCSY